MTDDCGDIRAFLNSGARLSLLADSPIPVLVVGWSGTWEGLTVELGLCSLEWQVIGEPRDEIGEYYKRCVELARLDVILRYGCDVIPTNSPLWASQLLYKPIEYGGDDKIMMFFDPPCLQPEPGAFHYFTIPGDPWAALKGIFIMGEDHDRLCSTVKEALEKSEAFKWSLKGSGRVIESA